VVARRGVGARAELASALDATFDCASGTIDPSRRPMSLPLTHPWLRVLFTPVWWRGRDVRRTANLRYGSAGRRHLLDVYHHRSHRGGPVLVYFHGGGFRSGDKNREAKPLLHRLARHGWVCISANYRLAPEARFPDYLVDAKRALAWARQHAERFGGDPSRIVVAGSSAGGYLATMCALTQQRRCVGDDSPGGGAAVVAAISLYGFYGSPDADAGFASSPHAYLHSESPPMFIAHGDLDTLVLVDDVRQFAGQLIAISSNPVVYAELHGAHHGFDLFRSLRFEAVVDAIEVFARTLGIR
jgi:acetyl esterase/lipase